MKTISETNFFFPFQTNLYKGKVRDVYSIKDELLVCITSDRISAFDHVLPRAIPYKGQVLNKIATHFLTLTKNIVPNWLLDAPHPNVAIGKKCEPYKIEMVIRGYLAGHAWRVYKEGGREVCGVKLPEGLKQNDPLPKPIITPSTKADEGHDMDISKEEIIKQGIASKEEYEQLEVYTHKLFEFGTQYAKEKNLILVDTKYEFGKSPNGEIMLIDEVHTPDSSRYFYLGGYQKRQDQGIAQKQLSKEFVREWLMEHGFQGLEGQNLPSMSDDVVSMISKRYQELYENVIGETFEATEIDLEEIEQAVFNCIKKI